MAVNDHIPVVFDEVWKKFRRGERHDSLRDLIPAMFKAVTGNRPDTRQLEAEEFWALKDVSFEVPQGRALGIIGPNGAGKSTTLKLLTRILRPTRGVCAVHGRAGALIEVAAGFHQDLTGRENIYLQGSIMGMKRAEVNAHFDEIVEFAGVGAFIDTQVKRYSSGMNARLGFSIAAHLNPDVLIIDEVLSVGDMAFQERCIERMRTFKRNGVTIVFVSHNLQAVVDLCDEAIYLRGGLKAAGSAPEVINQYVQDSFAPPTEAAGAEIVIRSTRLTDSHGALVDRPVTPGTPLCFEVEFEALAPLTDLTFAMIVARTSDQLTVYDGHFSQVELGLPPTPKGVFTVRYDLLANLTRGQYFFDTFVYHNPTQGFVSRLRPAAHLNVAETRTWGGIAHLGTKATLHQGMSLRASGDVFVA